MLSTISVDDDDLQLQLCIAQQLARRTLNHKRCQLSQYYTAMPPLRGPTLAAESSAAAIQAHTNPHKQPLMPSPLALGRAAPGAALFSLGPTLSQRMPAVLFCTLPLCRRQRSPHSEWSIRAARSSSSAAATLGEALLQRGARRLQRCRNALRILATSLRKV